MALSRQEIKEIALKNGFKLRDQQDGSLDLNEYVYNFAQELISKCSASGDLSEIPKPPPPANITGKD